jgi:hypothetical protein
VPQASSEGSKRVALSLPLSFEDVLDTIHKVIGCSNVPHKPNPAYKLSTATAKARPIDLCTDMDCEGCLEDVAAAELKKKKQAIPVIIVVADQVYFSFCACSSIIGTHHQCSVYELTLKPLCHEEETI